MTDTFDITIIGAGVVGLAVAARLSADSKNVLLVEKNRSFGQETSSRNSEVVHAGIYYPAGTLKARLCVSGKKKLYTYCKEHNIPHQRIGKLIVATSREEVGQLEEIKEQAGKNGVETIKEMGRAEIKDMEPQVNAVHALFSGDTGTLDSHALMRCLSLEATDRGVIVAYQSEVTGIDFDGGKYRVEINRGEYGFDTTVLINSAGLFADKIAEQAGMDIDEAGYRLTYCKGSYFSASPSPAIHHLVYPVPGKNTEGLGIHATIDLARRVRFGPDAEYVSVPDYSVPESKRNDFHRSVSRYLPEVRREHLHPDMCGIRPKLQGPGEPFRDFLIREESENGYHGLVNLIGIESPGLTSCLAIADHVAGIVAACR
jgi:L-2-hydroxyglutarate oxidase LhgO